MYTSLAKLSNLYAFTTNTFFKYAFFFNSFNTYFYKNYLLWNEGLYFDYAQKMYLNYFLVNFLIFSTYLFNDRFWFEKLIYYPHRILYFFNFSYSNYLINFSSLVVTLIGTIFFLLTLIILLV